MSQADSMLVEDVAGGRFPQGVPRKNSKSLTWSFFNDVCLRQMMLVMPMMMAMPNAVSCGCLVANISSLRV